MANKTNVWTYIEWNKDLITDLILPFPSVAFLALETSVMKFKAAQKWRKEDKFLQAPEVFY